MEELVAVTKIVETSGRQAFRQVGSEEESGQQGKEEMIEVERDGLVPITIFPEAEQEPIKQRDVVKHERVNEGGGAEDFTERRAIDLQESGVAGQAGADEGVEGRDGDVVLVQDAIDPAVRHDVRSVGEGTAQAVEAQGSIVQKVADVAGVGRHAAEGVGEAGGKGVQADQHHVN